MTQHPTPPPAGIEYKTAALAAPPTVTSADPDGRGVLATTDGPALNAWQRKSPEFDLSGDPDGTAWLIVAVTGCRDEVNDVIVPGAFRRTLAARPMKGVKGHSWTRRTAVQVKAMELLPGDPRLPDTLVDGVTPWPREAGALLVKCRYLLNTTDGREAWTEVKADGVHAAQSIGYRVTDGGSKTSGGVRRIYDLDVYEWSNVLHGAHPMATALAVKAPPSGGFEFKSNAGAVVAVRRARIFDPIPCGICTKPAAAAEGTVPTSARLICTSCLEVLDGLAVDAGVITREQLDEAAALDEGDELTPEEEFERAMADEQEWAALPDGTLVQAEQDPQRDGLAWSAAGRRTGRAW